MASDNIFQNSLLDIVSTEEFRRKHLNLSLTSLYSVEIKYPGKIWSEVTAEEIGILAYEAVLPGTSLELGQVFGDRQGVTEQYPTKRVYPPVDISFYVKGDYKIILFFEQWMTKISPLIGGLADSDSCYKFNYPSTYETNINIVKYEKNGRNLRSILDSRVVQNTGEPTGPTANPTSLTYSLLNAYPVNIISLPVSYDQSGILKTTVTFNYDRYVCQFNKGSYPNPNVKTPNKITVPPLESSTTTELQLAQTQTGSLDLTIGTSEGPILQ